MNKYVVYKHTSPLKYAKEKGNKLAGIFGNTHKGVKNVVI